MPFSKIFLSSRFLNLLKKGLESPGKVLEFHLHQRVDTPNYTIMVFFKLKMFLLYVFKFTWLKVFIATSGRTF
jgi:hypothetical protein